MIRVATVKDVPELVTLGTEMHREGLYTAYEYDPEKVRLTITGLINDLNNGIVFVAEHEGKVVGAIIGYVTQHWFGRDKIACDLAIFVSAEHRNGLLGARLIKRYTATARQLGCRVACVANSTGVQPERVEALFEALGYQRVGAGFKQDLGN